MNHLKACVRTRGSPRLPYGLKNSLYFLVFRHVLPSGIRYFLTYADKFATGYFRKQGFSNKLTLRKMLWDGHIKHYDGAELMECAIIQHVDYNAIPRMLRHQRDYLYRCVRSLSSRSLLYDELLTLMCCGICRTLTDPRANAIRRGLP